jgi:hypothetical protein
MIPHPSATSGGLTWLKVSSRNFELNRNGQVIGRLQRPSYWSRTFEAETQGGRWTFRRAGCLGGRSEIRDSHSDHQIADFKSAWGSRGGSLTFADGQTFHLQCNGWWRPVWSVTANTGELLVRLQRREKTVELPQTTSVPESHLALLVLFTWYQIMQSEEDAAMAVIAAG